MTSLRIISLFITLLLIKATRVLNFDIFDSITISRYKFYWATDCEFQHLGPPIIITNNYDLRIPTIDDCAQKCTEYIECTHFTLYKDDDGCFLYTGVFRYINDAQYNNNTQCGVLTSRMSTNTIETRFGINNFGIEIMNKCSFENQDLTSFQADNIWECGEKCSELSNCTQFNYNTNEKLCIAKEGIRSEKDIRYSENNCGLLKSKMLRRLIVSKYGWRYNWERNCDFIGQNLDSNGIEVNTMQECIDKCNEYDLRCTHFSYSKLIGKCYLKYGERRISEYLIRSDFDCGMIEIKRWQQIF